jgi:hypothetical protein
MLLEAMPVSRHQAYILITAADAHNVRLSDSCYVGASTTLSCFSLVGADEPNIWYPVLVLSPTMSGIFTSDVELGKWLSFPVAGHASLAPSVDRESGYPDQ